MALNITCTDGDRVLLTDANDEQVLLTVHRDAIADQVRLWIQFEPLCPQNESRVVLQDGDQLTVRMPNGEGVKVDVWFRHSGYIDQSTHTERAALILKFSAKKSVQILRGELVPYRIERFLAELELDTKSSF